MLIVRTCRLVLQSGPSPHGEYDWGAIIYMISRQGAKEILKKYLLPDGRWNLLVCEHGPQGREKGLMARNGPTP